MISMIPLFIVSIFFYRYNLDAVKKNVQQLNRYQLTQITNIIEREYKEYFFIAKRLEQEPELCYRNLTGTQAEKKHALNVFQYHMVDAVNIANPFLWIRDENLVYSKNGIMDYDAMSSKYYMMTVEEKNRFHKWMNEENVPSIGNLQTYELISNQKKEEVVFQFPIRNHRVSVFFVIDRSEYLGLFSNMIDNVNGYAFVLEGPHKMIATNNPDKEDCRIAINFLKDRSNEKNGLIKLADGKDYSIINTKSDRTGWICAVALPESIYHSKALEDINRLILVFTVIEFICAGTGIALSFAYYKPLRRIVQETDVQKISANGNEYDMISGYFKWKTEQNQELRRIIHSQTPYVKDRVLDILLYSDITQEEFDQNIKNIDLDFKEPYFFVITLELDGAFDVAERSHYMKFVTEEIHKIQKNFVTPCSIYCMEHFGEAVSFLIVNLRDLNYKHLLFAEIKRELDHFPQQNIRVVFGCGNVYPSLWNLRKSYQEARVVSEYNVRSKDKEVLGINEIQELTNIGIPDYPVSIQSLFIQQIKEGDLKGAQDSFTEFCASEVFQDGRDSIQQYALYMCVKDIVTLAKEVSCADPECDLSFMLSYASRQALKKNVMLAAQKICDAVNKSKFQKRNNFKKQIIHYITENYCNPDLGLDSIAEYFGLSPVYMSRFIREQTGFNFRDYVTDIRMKEAKKMLLGGNISINEIVKQVGYYNTSSFIRKFRKIEGITPGEYRAKMRGKEMDAKFI
jgi:AraC-like DNA-binding protein